MWVLLAETRLSTRAVGTLTHRVNSSSSLLLPLLFQFAFGTGSHYVDQADRELTEVLLTLPSKYWY